MPKSFATLTDEVQSDLGDDTTTYTDAKVAVQIERAVRKVSEYKSAERRVSYFIESRTGTADEDKANALVDDAKTQFISTAFDVEKEVHNTTDNTWAVVTAFVDTGDLTLSKDIFPDGDEEYEIYNKGCSSKYQINIEYPTYFISPPHRGVIAVEYPIGTRRNFAVEGDILTIDVDSVADSELVDPANDTEVYVWFQKRHLVSQLTDLSGLSNTTEVVGATSMDVDTLLGGDTIVEGQEFTIADMRGTYVVTLTVVLSGSGAGNGTTTSNGLEFWPPLESALDDGKVISFIGSTLNTNLEGLVVELAAAYSALSLQANAISKGGTGTYARYETKLAIILNELERMRPRRTKRSYPTS